MDPLTLSILGVGLFAYACHRLGRRKSTDREEHTDSEGWRHSSTDSYRLLIDRTSDDGAHFTFDPKTLNLHATLNKGKTHVPMDTGLGGLTQWETLQASSGLERKTELRYAGVSTSPHKTNMFDEIGRNQQPLDKFAEDFLKKECGYRERERERSTTTDLLNRLDQMGKQGKSMSRFDPVQFLQQQREREEEWKILGGVRYREIKTSLPTSNPYNSPPIDPSKVLNYPQYGSHLFDEALRTFGGSKRRTAPIITSDPAEVAANLAERRRVERMRDEIYERESRSIRESITNYVDAENQIIRSMMPKVTPRSSSPDSLPLLPKLNMGMSLRSYTPGELMDLRGFSGMY